MCAAPYERMPTSNGRCPRQAAGGVQSARVMRVSAVGPFTNAIIATGCVLVLPAVLPTNANGIAWDEGRRMGGGVGGDSSPQQRAQALE